MDRSRRPVDLLPDHLWYQTRRPNLWQSECRWQGDDRLHRQRFIRGNHLLFPSPGRKWLCPGRYSNEISATALGAAIATETPAEGFTPGIKGTSSDLTPAPSVAN